MDLEDLRQVVRPADPQQIASGAERRAKRSGAVCGKTVMLSALPLPNTRVRPPRPGVISPRSTITVPSPVYGSRKPVWLLP